MLLFEFLMGNEWEVDPIPLAEVEGFSNLHFIIDKVWKVNRGAIYDLTKNSAHKNFDLGGVGHGRNHHKTKE